MMRRFLGAWLLPIVFSLLLILPASAAQSDVSVTFLDVGKADCMIIRCDDSVYMIDTAEKDRADDILDRLEEEDIDAVDVLFLTHYDKDHIGGAAKLLKNISVGAVYTTAYAAKESDTIDDYRDALEKAGLNENAVKEDTVLTFGELSFTLYPPAADSYESNDSSLVIRMTYGKTAMLFAGDIESRRIDDLLAADTELRAQLLKIPHHGIYGDSTEALIAAVGPDYAVITSSKSDKEDDDTVDALEDAGTEVFLTRKGTVTAVSDGRNITVTQE